MEADGILQPNPADFVYHYADPGCREWKELVDPCHAQTELVKHSL